MSELASRTDENAVSVRRLAIDFCTLFISIFFLSPVTMPGLVGAGVGCGVYGKKNDTTTTKKQEELC